MVAAPRLWPGSTIVCIASGPSLTVEDCEFVRGKAHVIAVSDGVRLAPWADAIYSSDRDWWSYYKGMPSFQGLKFGLGSAPKKCEPFAKYQDITVLTHTGTSGIELDPTGLRTGKNSGAAAVNLAVHLGASRIVLLGYDMGLYKGQSHFFGDHPSGLRNQSPYDLFRRMFETMVEPLQALGVEVLNCSRKSSLECFPRRALREVFASAEVAA